MSVSEWGGDSEAGVPGADVIASGSAAVDPEQSATASGHDGSGDLRVDLYRTLSPEAQELSTLIDEVAAFYSGDGARLTPWEDCRASTQQWYRALARAAVRALREGQ